MPGRSRSTRRRRAALGREAALYFRLAGLAPGDDGAAVRALADGVDWETLRQIARRDGTTSAVHRRLLAAGIEPPEPAAAALAREAQVLDFHRLRLERALAAALDLLDRAGLRVVLLKGAATSRVAYARPTDRPMSDADLLLEPAAADDAARLLREAGWAEAAGDPEAGATRYGAHHHLAPLAAPDGSGALLELHRDVLPPGHPFAWGGGQVLARAAAVPGSAALVPDGGDLLLHACLHFAWAHELRHGAWRTFADVAALLARGGADAGALVDPARAAARAERARAGTAVGWTLRLARELGGVRLPADLERLLPAGAGLAPLTAALALELAPGSERAPSVAVARLAWERALRPERSGHGGARPWLLGMAGAAAGRPPTATPRALAQVRRLGRWARWMRRVLGG